MDFFEKLSKKATETYKNVADKTNKIASESNIKSKMNDNKKKIGEIYTEIGKKVYQRYATDGTLDVKNDIQEELNRIDELTKEIENAEAEILTLSGFKKCVQCNQNVPINSKFCPACGAVQPEVEKAPSKSPEVVTPIAGDAPNVEEGSSETTQEEHPTVEEVSTEVETIVDEAVEEKREGENNEEENNEEEKTENVNAETPEEGNSEKENSEGNNSEEGNPEGGNSEGANFENQ